MQLHLHHPLEPDSASRIAAAIVEAAADISGAELDYSPASIDLVEDIVDGFRTDGVSSEEMAESLVAFGCYIGEILTRYAGGTWSRTENLLPIIPLVVRLPDTRECHPIDWVFRRLEAGADVSIRELYTEALPSRTPEPGGSHEDGSPDRAAEPR
ncbi:hypothetical protein [Streptomyces sp. E5N91]|uniref:hypothetical protein n=1 Tax=Streptomyces sp. E5N91 TaxID=1851996 RepID=UPI001EE9287E|nr:hypothetical protein [Streptomyces sp. E5N91]